MCDTVEETRGKWPSILSSLGFGASELSGKHGPCPFCGGKDRFRFDPQNINGWWICSQCQSKGGDGFDAVQRKYNTDFKGACRLVKPLLGLAIITPKQEETDKKAVMRKWFRCAGKMVRGDAGWKYLDSRCSPIKMERLSDFWLHPGLRHPEAGVLPCILAVTRDVAGNPCGCQRLFLKDGRKYGKGMTYGEIGCGVNLGKGESVVVGEGIETVLCACHRFGLPGFATLGAALAEWQPPVDVTSVIIASDNDKNFSGQKYAFTLANRLALKGIAVQVFVSPDPGTDWADHHEFIGAE